MSEWRCWDFTDGHCGNCLSNAYFISVNKYLFSHNLKHNKGDLLLDLWKNYSFHSHITQCFLVPSFNQLSVVLINFINMVRLFPLIIIPSPVSSTASNWEVSNGHICHAGWEAGWLFPIRTKEGETKFCF